MIDSDDQIEYDYLVAEYGSMNNDDLYSLTNDPEYDIIKDIRDKYNQYGQMSSKQRHVLARYLAYKKLK